MECSFCDSKEVVLISGYKYCSSCLWRVDEQLINSWIARHFPLPLYQIVQLCRELFGTEHYKISELFKLSKYMDRGPWLDDQRGYKISQEAYVVAVFKRFLEQNHKILFDRISKKLDAIA